MTSLINQLLLSLPGVHAAAKIEKKEIPLIQETEKKNQHSQLVQLENLGFRKVLEKEILYVFLKDSTFRPPPSPTILLVEEVSRNHKNLDHCIDIGETRYHVIGEEVINGNSPSSERRISFGKGFVLFPERRQGSKKIPSYFLIPPIAFPELEEKKEHLSITDIISVSPSTDTDDCLRDLYGFSRNPEFATILIGANRA